MKKSKNKKIKTNINKIKKKFNKLWNSIRNNKVLKKAFIYTLIFFIIYFILGNIFFVYMNTSDKYNLFFGSDSPRVLSDLTVLSGGHYRTIVHPLFVILFQPFVQTLGFLIKNDIIASIIVQSASGALSIGFMYLLLKKLNTPSTILHLLLIVFGISFSQIVFNSTIETYTFAQLFLIILFYYTLCRQNKKINGWDILILTFLGIANIGITLTNYFVYILALAYLLFFNKSEKFSRKISLFITLITMSGSISVVLSELQSVFFPGSCLFFKENLYNFIFGEPEEMLYIEKFSFQSIKNQIKAVFFHGFFAPKIEVAPDIYNIKMVLAKIPFYQLICIGTFYLFTFTTTIIFIKNNLKKLFQHKYLFLLITAFLFNFIFHLFYGNNESFIYTLHYQFLVILIFGYIFQNIMNSTSTKDIYIKYIKYGIIISLSIFLIIELLANINGIVNMAQIINNNYGYIKYISKISYIIPLIIITILIAILKISLKAKFKIYIILIILTLAPITTYKLFVKKTFVYDEYSVTYKRYINQVKDMQKTYNVKIAYENQSNDFFLFGMGNRPKLFYTDGVLYDLNTNKKIKSYNIKKEMIIPNEYTVVLKTKDNMLIKIYENETGIYIKEDEKRTTVANSEQKINLPEFKNHKYSEILKVLHHELLFNIEDSILKPNIMVYDSGWYRDGMLGAMVLEYTKNTNLIKEWVDNIDSIYDLQNGVEEADNLGELLYLISTTNSQNDIKYEIINEINRHKEKNNDYIVGYTDGQILDYYPTVIAKYAIEKSGLDISLTIPKFDNYSSLTWFYKTKEKPDISYDWIHSPYIGWASYHTNQKSTLYIADGFYPLSYEQGAKFADYTLLPEQFEYYKSIRTSPTHVWDASEKFLFLIEQE